MRVWWVRGTWVRFPGVCVWLGGLEKEKTLISVELVAKVEEEACRLARETAGGGQGEVRRDEEVIDVFVVNLAGDGCVVAGRAGVAENSALVGGGPHEAEDCSIERGVGGAQIVEGQVVFGGGEDFGQVKLGLGVVADSDNGARNELCRREEVVVRQWWIFRGAEGADVNNCSLKSSSCSVFFHFVGRG